jgi:hypothetical protein
MDDMMEVFDEVLSDRIKEGSVAKDQFSALMEVISTHNQECASGREVTLQLVCLEGEEFVASNLTFLGRNEFLCVVGGYATSGVMQQMP